MSHIIIQYHLTCNNTSRYYDPMRKVIKMPFLLGKNQQLRIKCPWEISLVLYFEQLEFPLTNHVLWQV